MIELKSVDIDHKLQLQICRAKQSTVLLAPLATTNFYVRIRYKSIYCTVSKIISFLTFFQHWQCFFLIYKTAWFSFGKIVTLLNPIWNLEPTGINSDQISTIISSCGHYDQPQSVHVVIIINHNQFMWSLWSTTISSCGHYDQPQSIYVILLIRCDLCFYNQTNEFNPKNAGGSIWPPYVIFLKFCFLERGCSPGYLWLLILS